MHRLSVQCQTTDGHDAKADESNEATIGDHMFSFSGKQIDFLYCQRKKLIKFLLNIKIESAE